MKPMEELLARPKVTQWDVAEVYAELIRADRSDCPVGDWKQINHAIQARWPRGLVRVKRMAWRIVEGKVRA